MFWRVFESAIASALTRATIDARLDALLERVQRVGALSDVEAERLRREVFGRLDDVEREGRELRQAVDQLLHGLAERLLKVRSGGNGGRAGSPGSPPPPPAGGKAAAPWGGVAPTPAPRAVERAGGGPPEGDP
jgi:hypothetical protein